MEDHSDLDAYPLLVETDGKMVFYIGDSRVRGRKAALLQKMVRNPLTGISTLLVEGITIGRAELDRGFPSEDHLEAQFA